jgi:hypothetical protein
MLDGLNYLMIRTIGSIGGFPLSVCYTVNGNKKIIAWACAGSCPFGLGKKLN